MALRGTPLRNNALTNLLSDVTSTSSTQGLSRFNYFQVNEQHISEAMFKFLTVNDPTWHRQYFGAVLLHCTLTWSSIGFIMSEYLSPPGTANACGPRQMIYKLLLTIYLSHLRIQPTAFRSRQRFATALCTVQRSFVSPFSRLYYHGLPCRIAATMRRIFPSRITIPPASQQSLPILTIWIYLLSNCHNAY